MRGDLEAVGSWWVQKATSNPLWLRHPLTAPGRGSLLDSYFYLFFFLPFPFIAPGGSRHSLAGDSLILVSDSGFT